MGLKAILLLRVSTEEEESLTQKPEVRLRSRGKA